MNSLPSLSSRTPWTYYDLHMRVGSHLFDGDAWVAVYAGAGTIDDGEGNLRLQLVHPLQHWSFSPAIGCHVFKSCFSAVVKQSNK